MIMAASTSTVVPIQGTFDIAQARSALRLKVAQRRLPTVFNARAAAAVTALGELILALNKSQPVLIKISTVDRGNVCGIELSTRFRIPEGKPPQWDDRKRSLERAATETFFDEDRDDVGITAYIWSE